MRKMEKMEGEKRKGRGRPPNIPRRKDKNGNFLDKTDYLIIEALRLGPQTFTGVRKKLEGWPPTTLFTHLKKLEKLGYVERDPRDHRILRLTYKVSEPEWRILQSLNALSLVPLDIEAGRKLLTEEVVGMAMVVSSLQLNPGKYQPHPQCIHPPSLYCYRELEEEWEKILPLLKDKEWGKIFLLLKEELKEELNECLLLTALARFNEELYITEKIEKGEKVENLFSLPVPEELYRLLEKGKDDPEVFPVLCMAKNTGTTENFIGLLDWVRPLIEGPFFVEARRAYQENPKAFFEGMKPERIAGLEMRSIIFPSSNLASVLFWQRQLEYEREILLPLWRRKLGGEGCT